MNHDKTVALVVDDDAMNREILKAMLDEIGYQAIEASNGEEALARCTKFMPDIVLMDIEMPVLNGLETCSRMKQLPGLAAIPVIFLTGLSDETTIRKAFDVGAVDYLVKPFRFTEFKARTMNHIAHARLRDDLENQVRIKTEEIDRTRTAALKAIATLAETRDPETGAHVNRVQHLTKALGNHLLDKGIYPETVNACYVENVFRCSPLHDIGKVGIPDRVLLKPGKLTTGEFSEMKQHTVIGHRALLDARGGSDADTLLDMAAEIALCHHEKFNGNGYPNGATGENIPLAGRLVAMADVYDALTSKRVYKDAFSHDKAKSIMLEEMDGSFDPVIVKAFLAIENEFVEICSKYRG